ncbi:MAG: XRE family transcriptional regulator [Streptomyces sp.]|nr:XRE family transcriptional regulator [Streptomyces sp.]
MEQRTDFADLVRERRAELGISLRDLEARAIDPESGVQAKFGWLSKVENNKPVDTPKLELVKAVAAGLTLPLSVVKGAVMRQFLDYDPAQDAGVSWSEDMTTRIIAARATEMSDEDRRQLAEIAETFARRNRATQ